MLGGHCKQAQGLSLDVSCCCAAWCRADGARALGLAADRGFPIVGWTLLCHSAEAVPRWMRRGEPRPVPKVQPDAPELVSEMLLCHAVQCDNRPW